MKIHEYNQMMKYLTRPAEPEYEQLAMVGKIKKGADLIKKLVKKGEAPKTDVDKVKSKVEADKKNIQELADEGQILVKSDIPEPFAGKFEEEFMAHDNMFGRRSGDNKVDAQEIAEQVAEARGQDYYDLDYKEQMDLYDKAYNYLGLLDRTKDAMKEATGRTLQAEGGVARPTKEQYQKTIKKIQDFVEKKKAKGEEIFHEDLLKLTGKKKVSENVYMLKAAGVLDDVTKLAQEGRGPVQQKVQVLVDEAIDDFYTGKRPLNDLRPEILNKELSKKTGLNKIGKRNLIKYLNANEKYKEMIPVRNSITQSVTKQKGLVKEKLMKMTFQEAKTGDVVAKARPSLPQPKGVEEYILRDLRRYAVQNKNQGALFQITEDAKDFNKLKIFDAESGETLDKAKIKKYIKNNDPRFQEYVDTFKDVRKIKNKKYNDGTLNEALKKIKRGGVDASIQIGHVDGVGVNPLKNLEPQLAFANQAARAKGADFKQLGLQAPGGEGVPRKLTAEENINRFVKFADRSLKTQKPLSTKLYSGFSPELGKLSYEILKDVVKGIPTPLGAVGLNVGLGVDPKETIDRVGIEAELALAPELVKQSARFGPVGQRISNLLLSPKMAMRAARIASPIGILSLIGEAGYYTYKKAQETQAAINAMTPHQRELYESQMQGEALGTELGFANGGRVGFKKGGMNRRTFMKIMGGLASLPVVGKMAKPIAKVAPVVADKSSEIFFSLAEKIKSLGKLIGDVDVDPRVERTYRYKNYELKENAFGDPDQSIITREIGDPDFAGYGQESMILKKGGTTEEGVKVIDEIEEVTVRPDGDGKMKDIEFGIEDIDDFGALE